MARVLRLVVVVVAVAVAGVSVHAQEPSPSDGRPLPFEDYVVRLSDLGSASDAAFAHLGPTSTPAEIATAFDEALALGASDLVSARDLTPESCYAAAHQEILAYRESVIELTSAVLPDMAGSETVEDVFELIERIDAELHARHPIAYTEAPDAQAGFGGSHRNILAVMATCDPVAIPESIDPATERIEFPAAGAAITLSSEWRAMDPALMDNDTVLGVYHSEQSGTCLVTRQDTEPATLQEVVELVVPVGYWTELADGYSTDRVETAAGAAARVTFWEDRRDLEARYWNAIYLIPTAGGTYSVQCTAEDGVYVAPADDWLSIAESFEREPEPADR